MQSENRIGTFEIEKDTFGAWIVRDTCAFNDWGVARIEGPETHARNYATWAHRFKTGQTFTDWSRSNLNIHRSLVRAS